MMRGNSRGFSLLEVMLVLALLGGISALAIGALPGDRQPEQAAAHLNSQLQWAAERASVEGQPYGLALANREWQWMKLVRAAEGTRSSPDWPGYVWQAAGASLASPVRPLPEKSRLQLTLNGEDRQLEAVLDRERLQPQILLLPGGETSQFTLRLLTENESPRPVMLEPLG